MTSRSTTPCLVNRVSRNLCLFGKHDRHYPHSAMGIIVFLPSVLLIIFFKYVIRATHNKLNPDFVVQEISPDYIH